MRYEVPALVQKTLNVCGILASNFLGKTLYLQVHSAICEAQGPIFPQNLEAWEGQGWSSAALAETIWRVPAKAHQPSSCSGGVMVLLVEALTSVAKANAANITTGSCHQSAESSAASLPTLARAKNFEDAAAGAG